MTPQELVDFLQTEDFNINNYQPLETDSPEQAAEKVAFLQSIAALKDEQPSVPYPNPIICMTNCVVQYLECSHGGGGQGEILCWTAFQNCLGNCQS